MDRRQAPGRALQHQHGAAQAGNEGAEHHQGEDVVGQAGDIRAQLGAAFQAPAQQRHGAGNGAQRRQADAQSQGAATQSAFRQPADHGVRQQTFEQPADQRPHQNRRYQAGEEQPAMLGTECAGHGIGSLATQVAQARQVFIGGADQ
ncbi:hypothetical protein D3C81_866120 [compost metagenome]